ncbi:glycosyltransferase family 2 protein [Agromyces aerolatus]|uniref:glycosyltransferase family 2 protein n=1 Tax=Agromyces sp. LY-1074 TaxID=3074080 RepID=UPI002854BA2F|nr:MULTISPECIES: glycosyltransferase family 2 protein [unclassified Agromyces]MDR5698290.1 glycosyltransferase family 2 protein [Agromyces sp. LY-1074]MDR5704584.1 glycosyltransferase family 2 protein [Agromyces sp. LY-1358]
MTTFVILVILMVGVNTLLWASAGALRYLRSRAVEPAPVATGRRIEPDRVAVLIPAHNEELVIGDTISSACTQVRADQVFVASDGSTDGTSDLARAAGANVLDLDPNRGKAGAIVAAIEHFELIRRFDVVLLLDADTRLHVDYLASGLPAFDDPGVVAVAGRATTTTDPPPATRFGRLLLAYRERFYVVVQYLLKYGQASRPANVVSIVPGFASMYRTSVLAEIDINAPGLVIEDFNMTFELHAKRLGRIDFRPNAAVARTQDPDTFEDYVKQMRRWTLGFWQTVRRHRARRDRFWAALTLYIVELVVSSAMLLLMIGLLLAAGGVWAWSAVTGDIGPMDGLWRVAPPVAILLGIYIPDLLLTIAAVIASRRPGYFAYAIVFPVLRAVDAAICLRSLGEAVTGRRIASGRWTSPTRRAAAAEAARPASS